MHGIPTSAEEQLLYLRWNASGSGGPSRVYRIAQRLLVTDVSLALPHEYGCTEVENARLPYLPESCRPKEGTAVIYRGPGFFAGVHRDVLCERSERGFFVWAEGRSGFYLSDDGCEIHRILSSDSAFDQEVLLGPVMTLSLALQGLYTLHLSAIVVDDRAVCFLGQSGAGKSTAARYLEEHCPPARRVVDDMAPFLLDGELRLVGGLPQPKMDPTACRGADWPSPTVACLLWLDEPGDGQGGIQAIGAGEVTRRLAASSMGTRLFDARLLARHLLFCARSAGCVAGYSSTLPRTRQSLETLKRFVMSEPGVSKR